MDTIYIKELRIETTIGVHAWEQQIKQPLILDLEYKVDAALAAEQDNLSATTDYLAISERLAQFIGESAFQLIETVAEKVTNLLLEEFALKSLRLTVRKPRAIPQAQEVGITICREA